MISVAYISEDGSGSQGLKTKIEKEKMFLIRMRKITSARI